MANILILGAGTMGTAFSFPCSDNNHSVTVVGTHLENDFIDLINLKSYHPTLECKIPKNVKFVKFGKLNEIFKKNINLIVIAVISKGIDWASVEISKYIKNEIPILVLTKGLAIHKNKYEVLAHKIDRIFKENGVNKNNISAAGGPCLAKGLSNRIHTSVVFANKNIRVVDKISKLLSTDYYHIFTSDDVIGVETCAAIKNIFSMVVGASEGLCFSKKYKYLSSALPESFKKKYSLNTAAALIQESINEMVIFTEKLKGKKETVMGLAGIGDLYVSADGGRNSQMGEHLGQGMSYKIAKEKKMPNVTVEGADLAQEIGFKVKKDFKLEKLPLMISMINTICDEKPLIIDWKSFK